MRLRTLPLSLAGIIAGIALASVNSAPDIPTVISLIFTAALLQILSNLSNELGDTLRGTDSDDRQGIRYSLQNGEMTIPQMNRLIVLVAGLCCISGLIMILCSFGTLFAIEPVCLLVLGSAAIWAALHYTLGEKPYGYRGMGDIFVFIFFGLVAVSGSAFVCSHSFKPVWMLPAAAFGLWSIGVLNVNNIRDMKTDASTRTTVALKLGLDKARAYQTVLILGGWILMLAFNLLCASGWMQWIHFIVLPLFAMHLNGVWKRTDRDLDPMLPMLVISTFATSLLFAFGVFAL